LPLVKELSGNNDEREKMFEYLLSSANELDDLIKNITDKTTRADYPIIQRGK
jgi:uncharacterized protein YdcH (DUF465 family)